MFTPRKTQTWTLCRAMSYNDTYDVESYGSGYAPMFDDVIEHYRDNHGDSRSQYEFQDTPEVPSCAPAVIHQHSNMMTTVPRSNVDSASQLVIQMMQYNNERTSTESNVRKRKMVDRGPLRVAVIREALCRQQNRIVLNPKKHRIRIRPRR